MDQKTTRCDLWKILWDDGLPFRWPPFLIDLALEFGFTDPAALLVNPAFIEAAKTSCDGARRMRVPLKFEWTPESLQQFCAGGQHGGFEHYIDTSVRAITNHLTKGRMVSKRDGMSRMALEDEREEMGQILRAAVVRWTSKFDPEAGVNGGNSGFEPFLRNFAINAASSAIAKILFARQMVSLDKEVDDSNGRTVRDMLEEESASALVSRPTPFQLGSFDLDQIEEVFVKAEREVLTCSAQASLYLLCISGARTVEQASSMLGMTVPTAYRHLQKTCRSVVDSIQRMLAHEAGLTVNDAREQILGYFLGSVGPSRNWPSTKKEFRSMMELVEGSV